MQNSIKSAALGGSAFFTTMAYYLSHLHGETTWGFLLLWLLAGAGLALLELVACREITAILVRQLRGQVDRLGLNRAFGGYWFLVGLFSLLSLPFAGFWPSRYLIGAGLVSGSIYTAFLVARSSGLSFSRSLIAVGYLFVPMFVL